MVIRIHVNLHGGLTDLILFWLWLLWISLSHAVIYPVWLYRNIYLFLIIFKEHITGVNSLCHRDPDFLFGMPFPRGPHSLIETDVGPTHFVLSLQSTFDSHHERTLLERTHETSSVEDLVSKLWSFRMFLRCWLSMLKWQLHLVSWSHP